MPEACKIAPTIYLNEINGWVLPTYYQHLNETDGKRIELRYIGLGYIE